MADYEILDLSLDSAFGPEVEEVFEEERKFHYADVKETHVVTFYGTLAKPSGLMSAWKLFYCEVRGPWLILFRDSETLEAKHAIDFSGATIRPLAARETAATTTPAETNPEDYRHVFIIEADGEVLEVAAFSEEARDLWIMGLRTAMVMEDVRSLTNEDHACSPLVHQALGELGYLANTGKAPKRLELCNEQLVLQDFDIILRLVYAARIPELIIDNISLTNAFMPIFSNFLALIDCPLKILTIRNEKRISQNGWSLLATGLIANVTLECLRIENTTLRDADFRPLLHYFRMTKSPASLKFLGLRNCELSFVSLQDLFPALSTTGIQVLDLSHNNLNSEGVLAAFEAACGLEGGEEADILGLTHLLCRNCNLTDESLKRMLQALTLSVSQRQSTETIQNSIRSLRFEVLDFRDNMLGPLTASFLTQNGTFFAGHVSKLMLGTQRAWSHQTLVDVLSVVRSGISVDSLSLSKMRSL